MTPSEIEMCVLDSLQDDAVENISTLLISLNGGDDPNSWEAARGVPFCKMEVQSALARLLEKRLVAPLAEQALELGSLRRIPVDAVGTSVAWESVWFHLELAGRVAVQAWWDSEGKMRYPLGGR